MIDVEFQRIVIETDNKCMNPGCQYRKDSRQPMKLHAHHIRYKSDGGENELDNGICLCDRCHAIAHNGVTVHGLGRISGRVFIFLLLSTLAVRLYDSGTFRWGPALPDLETKPEVVRWKQDIGWR